MPIVFPGPTLIKRDPEEAELMGVTEVAEEEGEEDDEEEEQKLLKEEKAKRHTIMTSKVVKKVKKEESEELEGDENDDFTNPIHWTISDVYNFIKKSNCEAFAPTFRDHVSTQQVTKITYLFHTFF